MNKIDDRCLYLCNYLEVVRLFSAFIIATFLVNCTFQNSRIILNIHTKARELSNEQPKHLPILQNNQKLCLI